MRVRKSNAEAVKPIRGDSSSEYPTLEACAQSTPLAPPPHVPK